ncbi:hypothetical protein QO239_28875, partial [Cupriavidus taiwanensis]|uniref:hypothetical protein n=1 Tax=Cupriavidus taiwanensis TaxID=164546 RepID=UPI002541FFF6
RKDDADSDNDNEFQYYASAELGGVKLRDLARYNSQLEEEGQPNCLDTLEINRERNTWPLQANNRAGGNDSVTA